MRVKSLKSRSAVSVAALAAIGATSLVAAPAASAATTASAASTTTATLAVNVPWWDGYRGFDSLRIDNGTSVTCYVPEDWSQVVIIQASRLAFPTGYQISAGTSYGISAWEGLTCGADGSGSLGGVTVTPTEADLSAPSTGPRGEPTPGFYWVTIP